MKKQNLKTLKKVLKYSSGIYFPHFDIYRLISICISFEKKKKEVLLYGLALLKDEAIRIWFSI